MSITQEQILKTFINNRELADVKFFVGLSKTVFYGHKFVVALVSPYWKNLLYSKGWEKQRTRKLTELYLPDLSPIIFRSFLQFAYTRKVAIKDDLVFKLWEMSEKYEIDQLKQYCGEAFNRTLSNENCINYYQFSINRKLEEWSKVSLQYIEKHSDQILKNSDCFLGMGIETIKSILQLGQLSALETDILRSLISWSSHQKKVLQQSGKQAATVKSILQNFMPLIRIDLLDFEGLELLYEHGLIEKKSIFLRCMKLVKTHGIKVQPFTRSGLGLEDLRILLLVNCRRGVERINDLKNSIMSTGIQNVNIMNCETLIPTFEQMCQYDAIVLRNRNGAQLKSNIILGNDLARYVETGRGLVVIAINTLINNDSYRIKGRIQDEGFIPLQSGERIEKQGNQLGEILLPNHPIMKGVNTFRTKTYAHVIDTHNLNDGTLIAKWQNGYPLISEKTKDDHGTVVCLNFHPISTHISTDCGKAWLQDSDGGKIIANSVTYVGMKYNQKINPQKN
ncbi:btb (poz) domain-containing 2a-related [Anaeramoeba flamelloides]|uniref:Btb (Poz) domain-containing 2a-related n=1 Tax=Anaeramoeba flamelloides TaxID=1746091 RepID=A0ABQ8YLI3_9EUKA|nr:btb (poz) domain-containing 2a-related [Anaeramoeba flamelloides]